MLPFLTRLSLILLFLNLPHTALAIAPFTTDGCSRFPDGTSENPQLWQSCCVAHDRAYWRGGTYAERLSADQRLRDCVSATGEQEVAAIMLTGVRLGGSPYWPTAYRWGYGWPWLRGYRPLTSAEQQQVTKRFTQYQLEQFPWPERAEPVADSLVGNFFQISPQLYRSAQPTARGFQEIEKLGIKTVLNLRAWHDDEDESAGRALQLERVAINTFSVDETKFIRALQIIRDAPKPLLVHCLHGSDRTGTVIALYRMLNQDWSREQAITEMTEGGFGFHAMFSNLTDYLHQVDLEQLRRKLAAPPSP